MPYTYPPAAPTISGDNVTISRFLNDPLLIARRLRTLLEQRYIADALLTGRFNATGSGSIEYETGESIFSGEDPRAVQPGGEYPLVNPTTGPASLAKTTNWGQDAMVTDASIARRNMDPVNRALTKLANQNVKYVDSVALSAISSAVTQSTNAAVDWSTATATNMLKDVGLAKANVIALNQGYSPDTVVLDDINWVNAMVAFVAAGYVPRETPSNNPAMTGEFPIILGMRWLASPNVPTANTAYVLDSTQLGGMADEDLGGPGYTSAGGVGVQAKTIRKDDTDEWRIRCRRVTVPIVLEPASAWKIAAI
jgi:hypothetical protein